jgi:hypothetical protein
MIDSGEEIWMNPPEILAKAMENIWRSGIIFRVQPSGPPETDWNAFADAALSALKGAGYTVVDTADRHVMEEHIVQVDPYCRTCGHSAFYHTTGQGCYKMTTRTGGGETIVSMCDCYSYDEIRTVEKRLTDD